MDYNLGVCFNYLLLKLWYIAHLFFFSSLGEENNRTETIQINGILPKNNLYNESKASKSFLSAWLSV